MIAYIAAYTIGIVLASYSIDYIIDFYRKMMEHVQNMALNDTAVKIITNVLVVKTQIEITAGDLYDKYPFVRNCTDMVCYAGRCCVASFNGHNIEPFGNNWISISTIEETNKELLTNEQYLFDEKYYYINSETSTSLSVNDFYKKCLDNISEIAKSRCKANVLETMVTMKVFDKYLYASYFNVDKELPTSYDLPVYNGRRFFLTVEYTHPMMKKGIMLDMPISMYSKTNSILTPVFFKRYLEYQEKPYVFDMRYVINIMDTNINMFTLKSNQYIKIKERGYDIITVYPAKDYASDSEQEGDTNNRPKPEIEELPSLAELTQEPERLSEVIPELEAGDETDKDD
jgi:hypothetical protein